MFSNKNRIDCSAKIDVLLKFNLCIFLWHVAYKICKNAPIAFSIGVCPSACNSSNAEQLVICNLEVLLTLSHIQILLEVLS